MVHPSNPRLMNRVVSAVVHLCEGKGSTVRDILDFLRQSSKSTPRNLTMQVQRALKHAVNAGLLRHRSGRYKALFTLNPATTKQIVTNESSNERLAEKMDASDELQPTVKVTPDRGEENRGKQRKSRRGEKRKRSRQRRRRRRSSSRRSNNEITENMGQTRKLKYKDKGERDRSPQCRTIRNKRMKADAGSASTVSPNRKKSKGKPMDEEYYFESSDNSDYEDGNDKAERSPACRESKYDESGKSSRRSVSQNRSPHRQQSQQLQPKRSREGVRSNKADSDDGENAERNDRNDQDADKDHEPNSGRSSTS